MTTRNEATSDVVLAEQDRKDQARFTLMGKEGCGLRLMVADNSDSGWEDLGHNIFTVWEQSKGNWDVSQSDAYYSLDDYVDGITEDEEEAHVIMNEVLTWAHEFYREQGLMGKTATREFAGVNWKIVTMTRWEYDKAYQAEKKAQEEEEAEHTITTVGDVLRVLAVVYRYDQFFFDKTAAKRLLFTYQLYFSR